MEHQRQGGVAGLLPDEVDQRVANDAALDDITLPAQ